MKLYNKTLIVLAGMMLANTGCKDYLNEISISTTTSDTYYTTANGYNDLIRSCYPLWRTITQERDLVLQGTDLFTSTRWDGTASVQNAENGYDATMNSTLLSLQTLWDLLYQEIGRCNTAVTRAPDVTGMDEGELEVRLAEAKFLRAMAYFHLVQQWGDVPMPLTETVTASKKAERVASATIYAQIISDLEEAESALPPIATDYGRATKGAAQFLLARVHLTRGWNFRQSLGGSNADFQSALQYADQVIAAYPLAARYSDLFPQHSKNPLLQGSPTQNDKNPEIVFAVQYSENVLTNENPVSATIGNNAHSIFGGQVETVPGNIGRTSDYNRHQEKQVVTPAAYRMFDPRLDSRYSWNFVAAQYALKDQHDFRPIKNNNTVSIDIKKGDTVILFRPWNDPAPLSEKGIDVGGTKPYAVYNVPEYGEVCTTAFNDPYIHPMMWKFWQPNIEYGDAFGTLDQILFRSAEAYLIAAEAIVKGASGGTLGGADVYYNKVLDRALGANAGAEPHRASIPGNVNSLDSVHYRATAATISIDMILDERARELMGENMRWYDLKRTGKLIERTKAMNPWTNLRGELEDHHLLRPIPQGEIDLSSPTISQNDGYK
ncbi:RagB/SusD family nutrient uptake outer membrane protein [Chitinophaga cymbidii]|uniref:Starch-binding protein n=1 Tax=Chitinophaga cymbidii TaxID=1096750 RepID=A0A512RPH4_9BACT|nr:RagB/SusD family nutrient uptake outer membrane protein [Chitinophaga cymbidii]GEP97584.1 hypothetical protein CCY01nite_38440 [Chitinophaga cymbidii]